jgi:two-component system sensor histidine kinase AtoS
VEIKRVFHELIQNSIQAIPSKGEISISSKMIGSEIQIIFKDNGIGVPQEIKAKLFEPFISSKKSGEGIGLGLYISKKIIEIHNGGIIHYNQEYYTVFQITLPI